MKSDTSLKSINKEQNENKSYKVTEYYTESFTKKSFYKKGKLR